MVVDTKRKLIVEQEVTNLGSGLGQLAPTTIPARRSAMRSTSTWARPPGGAQITGQYRKALPGEGRSELGPHAAA